MIISRVKQSTLVCVLCKYKLFNRQGARHFVFVTQFFNQYFVTGNRTQMFIKSQGFKYWRSSLISKKWEASWIPCECQFLVQTDKNVKKICHLAKLLGVWVNPQSSNGKCVSKLRNWRPGMGHTPLSKARAFSYHLGESPEYLCLTSGCSFSFSPHHILKNASKLDYFQTKTLTPACFVSD